MTYRLYDRSRRSHIAQITGVFLAMVVAIPAAAQNSSFTHGNNGAGSFTCWSTTNTGDWLAGQYSYPNNTYWVAPQVVAGDPNTNNCYASPPPAPSYPGEITSPGPAVTLAPGNWSTPAYPNAPSVSASIGAGYQTTLAGVVDPLLGHQVSHVSVNNLDVGGQLNIYGPAIQGTPPAGITMYGNTLTNDGSIAINGNGSDANLQFAGTGNTAITGTGTISMTSGVLSGNTIGQGAGHTIAGDGTITAPIASNAGLVTSNTNSTLVINNGGQTMANTGTLQATVDGNNHGSTLVIGNATIDNTGGGIIQALGPNSTVKLGGVTVQGGTLNTTGGSTIQVVSSYYMNQYGMGGSGNATFDGSASTLTNNASVVVVDGSSLTLAGTIANTNAIMIAPNGGNTTSLLVTGSASLQGGGTISMAPSGGSYAAFITGGGTLTNADNTITGAGQIGNGNLTLVNQSQGTVNSNSGGAITINTGANTVTNNGLMEATNHSQMVIASSVSGGGTINAANSSLVWLTGDATISGNTFSTGAASAIYVGRNVNNQGGSGATLDGTSAAVSNNGYLEVRDNAVLTLTGSIVNSGNITTNPFGGNTTNLTIAGTATLTGGGLVNLAPGGQWYASNINGTGTLVNVDNTIAGSGQIGIGQTTLVNQAQGTIDSNAGSLMIVNTGANTITNDGLMEATNHSQMVIASSVSGGGTINAANSSLVWLTGDATIGGNTFSTGAASAIYVGRNVNNQGGSGATLDGTTAAVGNNGYLEVRDNAIMTVKGTIANTGTIVINPFNGNFTGIDVAGSATLQGGGTLAIAPAGGSYAAYVYGSGTLTNADNLITGSGQLGNGLTSIANGGTIQASGGTLTVNAASLTNTGTLQATGGTLNVNSTLTNYNAGTLTGGAYRADQNSSLNLGIGPVTNNNAVVTLNGSNSNIGAINSVSTNNGTFNVQNGRGFGTVGNLANNGTINVTNGSTLAVNGTMTNAAGATLNVDHSTASFSGTFTNNGRLVTDPSVLSFVDLAEGSSAIQVASAGDRFILTGSFLNHSTQNTAWDTSAATIEFAAGGSSTHQFLLTGQDAGSSPNGWLNNFAWGSLQLDAGQILSLASGGGSALYIGDLLGALISGGTITNIFGNGFDLYYDPTLAANAYLSGGTYMLAGGGELLADNPAPEPGTLALLLPGLAMLGWWRATKTAGSARSR